jgi:hypothetical protein
VDGVAAALERIGWRRAADELRGCGKTVMVRRCDDCDLPHAEGRILVTCGLRVCPMCARRLSQRRRSRIESGFKRVPGYVEARRGALLDKLVRERDRALAAADLWTARAAAARTPARRAAHEGRAARAAARANRLRWTGERLVDRRWSFKMITISPKWQPGDPAELSIDGLRRRVKDVWARFEAVWKGDVRYAGLRLGGLTAAAVSTEISAQGHVHLHVLAYLPYVTKGWLAKRAGCFVDVREVSSLKEGLGEACKYVTKLPSPGRTDWLVGARFGVMHEDLAARWLVATSRRQLARNYGPLRDGMAAAEAAREHAPDEHAWHRGACRGCGKDLSKVPARGVPVVDLARELGPDFWRIMRLVRGP